MAGRDASRLWPGSWVLHLADSIEFSVFFCDLHGGYMPKGLVETIEDGPAQRRLAGLRWPDSGSLKEDHVHGPDAIPQK